VERRTVARADGWMDGWMEITDSETGAFRDKGGGDLEHKGQTASRSRGRSDSKARGLMNGHVEKHWVH